MISTTRVNVNFRHIFKDVVQGFSKIYYNDSFAYLKHLSVFDQVDIEDVKNSFYEEAKRRGLPTKGESLSRLKDELMWTDADESKLKQQYEYLDQVEKTKKKPISQKRN